MVTRALLQPTAARCFLSAMAVFLFCTRLFRILSRPLSHYGQPPKTVIVIFTRCTLVSALDAESLCLVHGRHIKPSTERTDPTTWSAAKPFASCAVQRHAWALREICPSWRIPSHTIPSTHLPQSWLCLCAPDCIS